jgi:hypothetical protein
VEEHVALLSFINATPNSFNVSESSPKWRAVHQKMLEVYQQMNVAPQQSTALHGHFVELYSALKQGICALSLQSGAPKCLTNLTDANRKFQPKKWWSCTTVVETSRPFIDDSADVLDELFHPTYDCLAGLGVCLR